MRLLIVTYDFPPTIGGIETRVTNYISCLTRLGHQVIVVAISPSCKSASVERFLGATVYRYPPAYLSIVRAFLRVRWVLRGHPPPMGVFILTGANTALGISTLIYGRLRGVKTGIFLYGKDILSSKRHPLKLLLLHLALTFTDRVGVNSRATQRLLPNLPHEKVRLLYPGVDLDELGRFRMDMEPEGKRILFVGRLIKRKGVDDLLHAFRLVLQEMPDARLVIVGDGPQKPVLMRLAERLGISSQVEFKGALRGEALYREYQRCAVFVAPSKTLPDDVEGFGIVFLEAGFFGKPSVGTWSGGIPEAVLHNRTGILVPEGDVKALAKVILRLLRDRELAHRLGNNAQKRVIKEFSWKKATKRLLEMLQD